MRKHATAVALVIAAVLFVAVGTSEAQESQADKGLLQTLIGEYTFVAKVEVSDMTTSVNWYTQKLGFVVNPKYVEISSWRQLSLPGLNPSVQIGLYQPSCSCRIQASGGAVSTIVVKDIHKASATLKSKGVACSPLVWAGEGVCECFFKDPDGNQLGLRQNGMTQQSCTASRS